MRIFASLIALGLTACATATTTEPSLARRSAEAIDPRLPIPADPLPGPVDAALAARLDALVADGQAGASLFDREAGATQRLVDAAGPAQSESWIVAQQSLSALEAAQARTSRALGDLDELAARTIQRGGLSADDLRAVEAASSVLRAISERQAQTMARFAARLSR